MPLRVSCPGPLLRLACLGGGGPVPVPSYLAWGCGGGKRASLGGVPSTVARGVWGQALPLPKLPAHWASCWGPLRTCCGRRPVGVGAKHCLLGLHALWGLGAAGVVGGRPLPGLGLCAPRGAGLWRSCAGGRGGVGGGGACAVPPVCAAGGGLYGGGSLCLVPSLCLPWAGNKAGVTGVVLVMGGVAPHTTPVRARPPSLGAICAASWRVGAGSLVPRCSCGRGGGPCSGSSLRRGEGGPSPLPRGVGAGAPVACGPVGGVGGGGRGAASLLPLWVAARGSLPWPPSVICLCLGAYRKPIFLVLHLKIKLFPMFSITIDLVGKYRTQATARRRRT